MKNFLEKTFKLSENKTTVKTEIIAGLTTFFAMCYIVVVNPNQMTGFHSYLGGEWQGIWNAIFVGGIISAVIATLIMSLFAKLPFALAAGMGLNSFFFVTFILPAFISKAPNVSDYYGAGLAIILLSGVVFLILSVTGLRTYIAKSLPDCLKKAIPAGIGLFIALLGLKGSFIVTANQFTFVQLADLSKWTVFNDFGELAGGAAPVLVAFLGFMVIAILAKHKIKGNIIIGIIFSTILYYVFGCGKLAWSNDQSIGQLFSDFATYGVFNLNFKMAFDGVTFGSVLSVLMVMISFCLVDMFDTIGTLYGTASEAGMLDENGDPHNVNKAMFADAVGTVVGAALGTSTVTTYVESAAGVAEGGRTGLTSFVTSMCLLACLFLSPIAKLIPGVATAPALMWVGVLMLKNFSAVDMTDVSSAVPAFLALIMMPLTYSISNGIGIGAIAYVIIAVCTGKFKKKDIVVTIIALLFALRFVFVKM
ncbi:MAG: NCS2 family permease [Clostridia bacterium]